METVCGGPRECYELLSTGVRKSKSVGAASNSSYGRLVIESFLFTVSLAVFLVSAEDNFRDFVFSGYMIADEFPADIAAGSAYVAGHDEDGRPVLVMLCFFPSMLLHFGVNIEPSAGIVFECTHLDKSFHS